jgi:hypothetical protein
LYQVTLNCFQFLCKRDFNILVSFPTSRNLSHFKVTLLMFYFNCELNSSDVVFRRRRQIEKSDYYLRHFCLSLRSSVRPQ